MRLMIARQGWWELSDHRAAAAEQGVLTENHVRWFRLKVKVKYKRIYLQKVKVKVKWRTADMLTLRYYWKSKRIKMKKVKVEKKWKKWKWRKVWELTSLTLDTSSQRSSRWLRHYKIRIITLLIFKSFFPSAKCLCNFFSRKKTFWWS